MIIYPCSCRHRFQDEHYGEGNRAHTLCKTQAEQRKIRCTVCGKEKFLPGKEPAQKKESSGETAPKGNQKKK